MESIYFHREPIEVGHEAMTVSFDGGVSAVDLPSDFEDVLGHLVVDSTSSGPKYSLLYVVPTENIFCSVDSDSGDHDVAPPAGG